MNATLGLEQRFAAWNEFISTRKASIAVDPLVFSSWDRCWGRINPHQRIHLTPLNPDYLLSAQVASFELISLARPVMEDIYQYVERMGIAVALVNSAGCILDIFGDADILKYLVNFGITTGVLMSETPVGTNAFAISLTERVPGQVIGAEHYLQQFQGLGDAAAPVFDLLGHPLGSFGLFSFADRYQPHILGLAVAGARAIEGQLKADQLLAEQNKQLAGLNTVLNSISEGILVWNADRVLMHVNDAAARIMDIPVRAIVGRKVDDLLSYPAFIQEAVEERQPLTDVEASIQIGDQSYDCVLSLRFVKQRSEVQWVIVSFRLGKDVTRLVQRQFGAQATFQFADLVGESRSMRKAHRLANSAAAAKASILIRGENGTGKTMLASAIHNESPRRDEPFLIFACSSVPTESLLPELLGYEEGFSSRRPGGRLSKFELAQGGTLYLQDVDSLSLEAQAILLNILELRVMHRLGSDRPIPLDVRFIASTSADLEKLIAEGSFRSDLYYRISPFEIELPPLRERKGDISLLVDRVLNRLSRQLHYHLMLGPDVMDMLQKYSWPGNLRELDAVLSRAAAQAGISESIMMEHLPQFILQSGRMVSAPDGPVEVQSLEEMEGDVILRTASLCNGNVSEMARLLRVGRTTVWRKLKEFDIPIEQFRRRPEGLN